MSSGPRGSQRQKIGAPSATVMNGRSGRAPRPWPTTSLERQAVATTPAPGPLSSSGCHQHLSVGGVGCVCVWVGGAYCPSPFHSTSGSGRFTADLLADKETMDPGSSNPLGKYVSMRFGTDCNEALICGSKMEKSWHTEGELRWIMANTNCRSSSGKEKPTTCKCNENKSNYIPMRGERPA